MTQRTDSLNCVDLVIDASTLPPSRPSPLSPKMREWIRQEQELLRRAGGLLPPAADLSAEEPKSG